MSSSEDSKVGSKKALKNAVITEIIFKKHRKIEPCIAMLEGHNKIGGTKKGKLFHPATKTENNKMERELRIKTETGNFTGNITKSEDIRTFIGVMHRKSGIMKLVEASTFKMVPDKNYSIPEVEDDEGNYSKINLKGKRSEKIDKKRKLTKEIANNISKICDSVTASIGETIIDVAEDDLQQSYENLRPERNPEAKKVTDVYSLYSIVSEEELLEYYSWAEEALSPECASERLEMTSELFRDSMAAIKLRDEDYEEQLKSVCVAFYVDALLAFYKLKGKRIHTKFPVADSICPQNLQSSIIDQFFVDPNNKRQFNNVQKDKLAVYILVLCLLINDCEVRASKYAQAVGINTHKAELLARVAGAAVTKQGTIVLRFPLTKPITQYFKKRKL